MEDLSFAAYWKIWSCLKISQWLLRRAGRHIDAAGRLTAAGAAWGDRAERMIDGIRAAEELNRVYGGEDR